MVRMESAAVVQWSSTSALSKGWSPSRAARHISWPAPFGGDCATDLHGEHTRMSVTVTVDLVVSAGDAVETGGTLSGEPGDAAI